jgi:hypothetical protein
MQNTKKENTAPGKTILRKLCHFFHFKTCAQNVKNTDPMNLEALPITFRENSNRAWGASPLSTTSEHVMVKREPLNTDY